MTRPTPRYAELRRAIREDRRRELIEIARYRPLTDAEHIELERLRREATCALEQYLETRRVELLTDRLNRPLTDAERRELDELQGEAGARADELAKGRCLNLPPAPPGFRIEPPAD